MKKLYTSIFTLLLTAVTFGQNGQIQNGGFENWSINNLYDTPTTWLSQPSDDWQGVAAVSQSTESSHGMYSCEITAKEHGPNPDTTFGYVLHGEIGEFGPSGGIAYTDLFDEITFDYMSDLPIGDTLYLLAVRFDAGGTAVEEIFLPAAYGTNATWTNGSISVNSTAQSELFIGFVLGNPFDETATPTPDVWARVDNVVLKNSSTATTNIPNFSFENWTSVSTEEPNNWHTINADLAAQGAENVLKTTDAKTGSFAVELSTVFAPQWGDTIGGFINLGMIDMQAPGNPFMGVPYAASPENFDYAYKYASANNDLTGGILIEFYNTGLNIGGGFIPFTDQASYFTGSFPLAYTGTPDSVIVMAYSGDSLNSVVQLDDLSFSGGDVGITEFSAFSTDVYPNPASDQVMIKADQVYGIEIVDVTGKMVYLSLDNIGVQTINTSSFKEGAYFVRITTSSQTKTHKLIIK